MRELEKIILTDMEIFQWSPTEFGIAMAMAEKLNQYNIATIYKESWSAREPVWTIARFDKNDKIIEHISQGDMVRQICDMMDRVYSRLCAIEKGNFYYPRKKEYLKVYTRVRNSRVIWKICFATLAALEKPKEAFLKEE